MPEPRVLNAGNGGAFTLDGTRTHLVGRGTVAVVRAVESADRVLLLQTHDHDDHAGAAPALASRLGARVLGAGEGCRAMDDGETVRTDEGSLIAVSTPGHAREHLSFHWPDAGAVFVGDLVLGRGETTWVGAYPGCVADYLASLDRIEALEPEVLYPAHGAPIRDPAAVVARFREHRLERVAQVRRALEARPDAEAGELVERIHGEELPPELRGAARASVEAHVHHVRERGRSG